MRPLLSVKKILFDTESYTGLEGIGADGSAPHDGGSGAAVEDVSDLVKIAGASAGCTVGGDVGVVVRVVVV